MDDNKKKALAAALGQIERQFGKGAVMRMAIRTVRRSRLSLLALWVWISRSALAACQKAVSLKSTVLNPRVKPP
jgi:hypothetical protein